MSDNKRVGPATQQGPPMTPSAATKQEKAVTQDTPFAHAAQAYVNAGWAVFPLPYGQKAPPPRGATGRWGADASPERVTSWAQLGPRNIGVRAPDTLLGLDVDSYKADGAATIAAAEAELGELPLTIRSSARTDGSGIRWFRVPAGKRWKGSLGPGVEVVQWCHRYAVVWPSVHPEAGIYEWLDDSDDLIGGPLGRVPSVNEAAELPERWQVELDNGSVGDVDAKAQVDDVHGWLAELPGGEPCRAVQAALDSALAAMKPATRHDAMTRSQLALVRMGEQGHHGAAAALQVLEDAFVEAVAPDRSGGADDAQREWDRGLVGAVGTVVAKPTPEGDQGCCPDAADDFAEVWSTTPVLDHIRQAAHARYLSAPALLAYVLGRVLVEVPPTVQLPPVVGAAASLNMGVAVVGGSGSGKSALFEVSRELLGERGEDQQHLERQVGSGEGLVQTFLRRDPTTKEMVLINDPTRIVAVDEIDQLAAIKGRSGATLGPTVRSALTGGQLGSENADTDRKRNVPANSYRLLMVIGVQPTRSAALLEDSDAGTPQRLVWVPATDPSVPEFTEWPGELKWSPPDVDGFLDYPEHVKAQVRATRLNRIRGGGDELEGHVTLLRLKLGAALALLHGETFISDEWWTLAGRIVGASRAVQEHCKQVLAAEGQKRSTGVAVASARAEEAADEDRIQRCAQLVLKKVREADGEWVPKHLTRPTTPALRLCMDDAIEALRHAGQVDVEEYESRGKPGVRIRVKS